MDEKLRDLLKSHDRELAKMQQDATDARNSEDVRRMNGASLLNTRVKPAVEHLLRGLSRPELRVKLEGIPPGAFHPHFVLRIETDAVMSCSLTYWADGEKVKVTQNIPDLGARDVTPHFGSISDGQLSDEWVKDRMLDFLQAVLEQHRIKSVKR